MISRGIKKLNDLSDRLIYILERINMTGYIEYLENTNRLLYTNFLIGLARGIGYAIGFSLLGAIIVYIIIETGIRPFPEIREYLKSMI